MLSNFLKVEQFCSTFLFIEIAKTQLNSVTSSKYLDMKQFQTDTFKLIIHDNHLKEFIVRQNQTLEAKDVWESKELSKSYLPNTKFYVLMEGEENASVSNEARRAAASDEYSKYTEALALCSNSSYMAIVGNLFLKINKPKVPTRFFEERNSALAWLNELMATKK